MNLTYVPGIGPIEPRIAIIGEAPSREEVKALTPFVGPSGKFLDMMLRDAGIARNECWVSNVCKYPVPPSDHDEKIPFWVRAKFAGIAYEDCVNEIRNELAQIKPNIIVALGGTAFTALTGKKPISSWRGSIVSSFGIHKTIGTYHPAHILHSEGDVTGYWCKQILAFDLKRAKLQSLTPEMQLPKRLLQVCKSSYELQEFLAHYKGFTNPAIDIEASGTCLPSCIGIAFTKSHGIAIPLFDESISHAEQTTLWRLIHETLSNQAIVGQNFGYDRDKIRRIGFTIKALHSDTMLKAFCINPELPKNLAFNTSIYTEEPYYKDEGMYEGSFNDLLTGCARDCCVTKEIDDAQQIDIDEMGLDDYYRKFILPLHEVYFYNEQLTAIEQNGFAVDEVAREALIRKYVTKDEELRHELFQLCGEYVNVASYPQLNKLLYQKLNIPARKGTGEEVLTSLLNGPVKNEAHRAILEKILEDRQVRKTISSYLLSPCDFDGRMRTSYYICLETGRSATSQQEPPIRPNIEYKDSQTGAKKKQARGMAFQTITKHGDIGADIRRMLVPDEGHVFLQADSAQAEARVIFLLAEDYQALEDIDTHDYHALTASWFFGGTEDDYSKRILGYESPIRFVGKTLRHAGHLGASKRRAAISVNTDARKYKINYKISEPEADRALKIFHEKQPKIRGVFHAGIIECLTRNRKLIAPVPYGIDASTGGTRIFFERWGDELFRSAFSYFPQRVVSENTKGAALRIRQRNDWIRIIVESHDSLLVQVKEDDAEKAARILKQEFEVPINFKNCSLSRGELVIPCEVEYGRNYKDLSKFKFL